MRDMTFIAIAFSSIKTSIDLTNELKKLDVSFKDTEVKLNEYYFLESAQNNYQEYS